MNNSVRNPSLSSIRKDNSSKLVSIQRLTVLLVLEDNGAELFDEFAVAGVGWFDDQAGEEVAVDERDVERLDCLCDR